MTQTWHIKDRSWGPVVSAGRLAHIWPSPMGNPPGPDILPFLAVLSSNSHLVTRESSKCGLDDGLHVDEGGEDL
jgi:hypothetical protein